MPPRGRFDSEQQISDVAKKLRDSAPDTERVEVETDESVVSMRREARGPSLWERLKPALIKGIGGILVAAVGTGGGVMYQGSRPPPSVVEVRKLREALATEQAARETDKAVFEERVKNFKESYKDSYSTLRQDLYQEYRHMEERVKSLEAYKAEKEAEERRKAR